MLEVLITIYSYSLALNVFLFSSMFLYRYLNTDDIRDLEFNANRTIIYLALTPLSLPVNLFGFIALVLKD